MGGHNQILHIDFKNMLTNEKLCEISYMEKCEQKLQNTRTFDTHFWHPKIHLFEGPSGGVLQLFAVLLHVDNQMVGLGRHQRLFHLLWQLKYFILQKNSWKILEINTQSPQKTCNCVKV